MSSRLIGSTILLTLSIILCLSLPRAQANQPTAQPSVYLPIVLNMPPLALSEPHEYASSQYSRFMIGEVVNLSATQAFSVTLQAVVHSTCGVLTETLIFPIYLQGVVLPRHSTPYSFGGSCSVAPLVQSLSFYRVVPISASTIHQLTVIPKKIECAHVYSYGYITGLVRNDNPGPVAEIYFAVWSLRDDSSLGMMHQYIAGPLAPGEEQAFSTFWFSRLCTFDPPNVPKSDVSLNSFHYAAQGTIVPSP